MASAMASAMAAHAHNNRIVNLTCRKHIALITVGLGVGDGYAHTPTLGLRSHKTNNHSQLVKASGTANASCETAFSPESNIEI
jgi:hypothetical protein